MLWSEEATMWHIIESLTKKIGLSSNQLLKCVLLNTAIELFSYIDASHYTSGYLYQDWSMDDFDHFFGASTDTGQIFETADFWPPSLSSDRIDDQVVPNQDPSMEVTAGIASVDDLETMYLPIPDHLCVQAGQVNGASDSNPENKSDKAQSFYYLVGPANLWLEFPMDMQAIQVPPAPCSTEDYLAFCAGKELSFLNTIPGVNGGTKEQERALNDCAVQTIEDLVHTMDNSEKDSLYRSLNHEAIESIIWDSYDLHLSRSPMGCAHTKSSSRWETEAQDLSNIEDLFALVEEEMVLLAQEDVEDLLGADFYPLCSVAGEAYPHKPTTKLLGEHPVSSTPYVEKTRASIQRCGEVAPGVLDSFLLFENESS